MTSSPRDRHPGDRELRGGAALLLGDRLQSFDQREVSGKILALKARHARADFARRLRAGRAMIRRSARATARRRRRARCRARAGPAGSTARSARLISEYSICRAAIGCDRVRAPHRSPPSFRQSDVAHEAGLHHVGDRADRVLDRHRGIDARRLVEGRRSRCRAGAACRRKSSSPPRDGCRCRPRAVRAAQRAELHRNEGLVAPRPSSASREQQLVLARRRRNRRCRDR